VPELQRVGRQRVGQQLPQLVPAHAQRGLLVDSSPAGARLSQRAAAQVAQHDAADDVAGSYDGVGNRGIDAP
jgi:tRNA G37 N-methylase TrmD